MSIKTKGRKLVCFRPYWIEETNLNNQDELIALAIIDQLLTKHTSKMYPNSGWNLEKSHSLIYFI